MALQSLIIHAEDLNKFVEQFQHQQDEIIKALIDIESVSKFRQAMRLEIKTILTSAVWSVRTG